VSQGAIYKLLHDARRQLKGQCGECHEEFEIVKRSLEP
jgi:hypothetical protein